MYEPIMNILLGGMFVFAIFIGIMGIAHPDTTDYQGNWDNHRNQYKTAEKQLNENESIIMANKYKMLELTDKGEIAELKKINAKLKLDNQGYRQVMRDNKEYMKSWIPPTRGSYKLY